MRQEIQRCCLDHKAIAARLRDFLEGRWPVQEDQAKELGYSPSVLSRWLTGRREMSISTLAEIVQKSGANGHYILTGEGDPVVNPGQVELVLAEVRGLVTDPAATVEFLRRARALVEAARLNGDGGETARLTAAAQEEDPTQKSASSKTHRQQ